MSRKTSWRYARPSESREDAHPIVPVVDLATDDCIGYLSAEYLHTRARTGLTFYAVGRAWRILVLTPDESILVLPVDETKGVAIDAFLDPKIHRRPLVSGTTRGSVASHRTLVLEYFKNYLILHSPQGTLVNRVMSVLLDAILTEEDLVRAVYSNEDGILLQTPGTMNSEELQLISKETLDLAPAEIGSYLKNALEARFPTLTDLQRRPVDDAYASKIHRRLRQRLSSILDSKQTRKVYLEIKSGALEVKQHSSHLGLTHFAKRIINEFHESDSAAENRLLQSNGHRLQSSIKNLEPKLICISCMALQPSRSVRTISEKPRCNKCASQLLTVADTSPAVTQTVLRKKRSGRQLNAIETGALVRARRCADIVLAYGRRGVIALCVVGVGPQTASRILAKMHNEESSFYRDLLEAKLHFLRTREHWNN